MPSLEDIAVPYPVLIHVGYWSSENGRSVAEGLPWPEAGTLKTDHQVHEALGALSILESRKDIHHVRFMGVSKCRLCGIDNGNGEMWLPVGSVIYCWPEGLKHYIAEHRVALPKEIRELLRHG